MAREREIRAALRSERDKEIEMVISKLEEQSAVQTEETQATLDCRMRRLKDKYEAQVTCFMICNALLCPSNCSKIFLRVDKDRFP